MKPEPRIPQVLSYFRALVLSCSLALATACSAPPGVVEGDVYLVEELGEEVELPNLPVHLLREDDGTDSTLARLCPDRPGERYAVPDEGAWHERARLLGALRLRTAATDAGAAFRLDSVAPGRYRLWADATVGSTRWTWLQRVRVRPGDTLRVNLTNANSDENPFRC